MTKQHHTICLALTVLFPAAGHCAIAEANAKSYYEAPALFSTCPNETRPLQSIDRLGPVGIGMLLPQLPTGEDKDLDTMRTSARGQANMKVPAYSWHLGYGGGSGHLNAGGTAMVTVPMLVKECGAEVADHPLHSALLPPCRPRQQALRRQPAGSQLRQ